MSKSNLRTTPQEDSGTCELVWFNKQKGYGEVRFVNTDAVAFIFAKDLPAKAKVGCLLNALATTSKDGQSVFWGGNLVVKSAELQEVEGE
jgi:hypothetical protein